MNFILSAAHREVKERAKEAMPNVISAPRGPVDSRKALYCDLNFTCEETADSRESIIQRTYFPSSRGVERAKL